MSNVNFNTARPTTGNLGSPQAAAQVNPQELAKFVESLPIADQVNLKGGAAAANADLPAIFEKLSARDKTTLMDLPPAVRQKVLTDGVPSDVDAAKFQISQNLLKMSRDLMPGNGIAFDPPKAWRVSDAAIAYNVLSNLSVADRARLEGTTFRRVQSTLVEDEHQHREADGLAGMGVKQGDGFLGHMGFKLATMFEKWALTAPLGLMLRAWFPHALCESHTREVEIGDAQATRMKEVMVHEIGHQVEFGKDLDLHLMNEWNKLSGWTDAKGGAIQVMADGRLEGFDPGMRPKRTDNFVYDNFTEDLTDDKVKEAAEEIADPELKAEFLQTAKVKKNLQGAIKEVFGIEAKGYSMTNPKEDFAESYRAYYNDVELLVRKAPDKFLFLNSLSRRYDADQVKALFERAGKDPKEVATALAQNGLDQDSLTKIYKVNGLAADTSSLAADAAKALAEGAAVPAFRKAWMTLQDKVTSKQPDLAFIGNFVNDPSKAFGDLWGQLSDAEKDQFKDVTSRQGIINGMKAGQMSYVSGANQGFQAMEVDAIQGFFKELVADKDFRSSLAKDPGEALAGLEATGSLPKALQQAAADPKTRENLQRFADAMDDMLRYDGTPLLGGGLKDKILTYVGDIKSPETLDAALAFLNRDPKKAARVAAGLDVLTSADGAPGS
jgi:hypothetical protein